MGLRQICDQTPLAWLKKPGYLDSDCRKYFGDFQPRSLALLLKRGGGAVGLGFAFRLNVTNTGGRITLPLVRLVL